MGAARSVDRRPTHDVEPAGDESRNGENRNRNERLECAGPESEREGDASRHDRPEYPDAHIHERDSVRYTGSIANNDTDEEARTVSSAMTK